MKATNTPTEVTAPKAPQMVPLSTAIMGNVITALVIGIAAFIAGYFLSINVNSQARQAVVRDMQVVSKVQSN